MLNYVGVRESAILTAVLAVASFVINVIVLALVSLQLDAAQWHLVLAQFQAAAALPPWPLLVGFSGSWLAYLGARVDQPDRARAAPAAREDGAARDDPGDGRHPAHVAARDRVRDRAARASEVNPDRFMFELGAAFGPRSLQLAIVATSAALLLGAANTALIGCYHVFLALVRLGFLPHWLAGPQPRFNTPHRAIVISVLAPVAVVHRVARAARRSSAEIYTFGLLGAFTLTSVGLDRVKWQERVRGIGFYLGILTSAARRQRVGDQPRAPPLRDGAGRRSTAPRLRVRDRRQEGMDRRGPQGFVRAEDAEQAATEMDSAVEILTVEEALDMQAMYRSTTLVALRAPNLRLFQEALARVRGCARARST